MAQILISSSELSPTSKVLVGASVTASGKRNVDNKPNANASGPVSVQTQAYENPTYVVNGVHLNSGVADSFNYADLLTIYKTQYTGSNPVRLTVTYGKTDTVLSDLAGSTSGIKVVLTSWNVNLDAKDSVSAYRPGATLTFTETA